MPLATINNKLVPIALEEVDTANFERFGQAFYGAIIGRAFVPLGGMHDGGAEGYMDPEVSEEVVTRHFLQVSKQENYAAKIRDTIRRLREVGRDPQSLTYITSANIPFIDREEEKISDALNCRVKIRDAKYIEIHINSSDATISCFNSFLRPALDYLLQPGAASIAPRTALHSDKTLAVFLRQEVEHRRGKTELLESVTDALIIWSLSETDPEKNVLMDRGQILSRIEQALPSARKFIRSVIDVRLGLLSAKAVTGGRQIRHYRALNAYCLPFETRELVKVENIEDDSLRLNVTACFLRRFSDLARGGEESLAERVTAVCHAALERVFEIQGLRVAQFAAEGGTDDELYANVSDIVAEVTQGNEFEEKASVLRRLSLGVLRGTFYNSSAEERLYLQKLSRTYILLLLLKNEPKLVEYFRTISSKFNLYIGTDFLVSALSEQYLSQENQTTRNLFNVLRNAGAKLILTETAVQELATHLRSQIFEFENYYEYVEAKIGLPEAEYIDRVLIQAYFFARLAPESAIRPPGWKSFIDQFATYSAIRSNQGSDELARYVVSKFGMEYETTLEMKRGLAEEDIQALADKILTLKQAGGRKDGREILAYNDALHVLRVYQRRQNDAENSPGNPFGFRTWWLTQDWKVRRAAAPVVAAHYGQRFMMNPEFLMNFIYFSPSLSEVETSFREIFPSVLGIQLSNRVNAEHFKEVLKSANEIGAVDEARAQAMITGFMNSLKGDFLKVYD